MRAVECLFITVTLFDIAPPIVIFQTELSRQARGACTARTAGQSKIPNEIFLTMTLSVSWAAPSLSRKSSLNTLHIRGCDITQCWDICPLQKKLEFNCFALCQNRQKKNRVSCWIWDAYITVSTWSRNSIDDSTRCPLRIQISDGFNNWMMIYEHDCTRHNPTVKIWHEDQNSADTAKHDTQINLLQYDQQNNITYKSWLNTNPE